MCVCMCVSELCVCVWEVETNYISSYLSCSKLAKCFIHIRMYMHRNSHRGEQYKKMFAAQQNTGSRKKYFNLVQNVLATSSQSFLPVICPRPAFWSNDWSRGWHTSTPPLLPFFFMLGHDFFLHIQRFWELWSSNYVVAQHYCIKAVPQSTNST